MSALSCPVIFPGLTTGDQECLKCLNCWPQMQDGRKVLMCTRWRRKANGKCQEHIESGAGR